jgi:hypothetical protein
MSELGILLFVLVIGTLCWLLLRRGISSPKYAAWRSHLIENLIEWNDRDDEVNVRQRVILLILVSILGLFFELAKYFIEAQKAFYADPNWIRLA